MRSNTFILLIVVGLSFAGPGNRLLNPDQINGTWIPIRQEIGGTSLPKAAFEKQKLIINDSTYTVIAESIDKGNIIYTNDKMDIYGKEGVNAGKHFTAIYKLENEQLTICYNLSGDSYPQTLETKGKPAFFLSVFVREQVNK